MRSICRQIACSGAEEEEIDLSGLRLRGQRIDDAVRWPSVPILDGRTIVAAAVQDALLPFGVVVDRLPLSPENVRRMLRS